MDTLVESTSVRQKIAEFTKSVHLELHDHPWISRLVLSGTSEEHYYLILSAYRQFYSFVESQRHYLSVFSELSLAESVAALDADCGELTLKKLDPHLQSLPLQTPAEILGSLYVLHGARFGAKLMQRNIAEHLPNVSQYYLSLKTPRGVWQQLLYELEQQPRQQEMFSAAKETFHHFGNFVTLRCESL